NSEYMHIKSFSILAHSLDAKIKRTSLKLSSDIRMDEGEVSRSIGDMRPGKRTCTNSSSLFAPRCGAPVCVYLSIYLYIYIDIYLFICTYTSVYTYIYIIHVRPADHSFPSSPVL